MRAEIFWKNTSKMKQDKVFSKIEDFVKNDARLALGEQSGNPIFLR